MDISKIGEFLNKNLFGKFLSTENDIEGIYGRLDKGKKVEIQKPTSYRNDFGEIAKEGDWDEGGSVNGIESTAIDDVKYDPGTNTASVKWKNGDKYYDFSVTPDEMKDFTDSFSKGQHVNNIWKQYNRIDG